MDRILKQRDRLLAATARLIGLTATGVAVVLAALPGSLPLPALLVSLPVFAALAVVQWRIGGSKALLWPVLAVVLANVLIVTLHLGANGVFGRSGTSTNGAEDAVLVLAAAAAGATAVVLTVSLGRMLVLVAAFAVTIITVAAVFSGGTTAFGQGTLGEQVATPEGVSAAGLELAIACLATVAGWIAFVTVGSVLSTGLLRASRRISSIGRAHRLERQASELEAQRRQGARLLHDTVLATLTLLAHSGIGVSTDVMRRQAGDDARLLRQLRLAPAPFSVGGAEQHGQADVQVAELGDTVSTVKQRFERLGLAVSWHGTDRVTLPPERMDAFLLALSECLENVRRHSGVLEAHVTITDDERTVRALVTDNGEGFDPDAVPAGRLGVRESIVGRLREVGGNARVFSSKGSGTTVVLEVPR